MVSATTRVIVVTSALVVRMSWHVEGMTLLRAETERGITDWDVVGGSELLGNHWLTFCIPLPAYTIIEGYSLEAVLVIKYLKA